MMHPSRQAYVEEAESEVRLPPQHHLLEASGQLKRTDSNLAPPSILQDRGIDLADLRKFRAPRLLERITNESP